MAAVISTIYVVPETSGTWVIHGEHRHEELGRFATRDEAIAEARRLAQQHHGQLVVRTDANTVEFAEDYASVER